MLERTKKTITTIVLAAVIGTGVAMTIDRCAQDCTQRQQQKERKRTQTEESKKSWEEDEPYQTICRRYAKTGLVGMIAIGRARELPRPQREIFKKEYENMVKEYYQLADTYKQDHPAYKPKKFYSWEVLFGNKGSKSK